MDDLRTIKIRGAAYVAALREVEEAAAALATALDTTTPENFVDDVPPIGAVGELSDEFDRLLDTVADTRNAFMKATELDGQELSLLWEDREEGE